jgi:hypothetical protein
MDKTKRHETRLTLVGAPVASATQLTAPLAANSGTACWGSGKSPPGDISIDLQGLARERAKILRANSGSGLSQEEALRNLTRQLEVEMAKLLAIVESLGHKGRK